MEKKGVGNRMFRCGFNRGEKKQQLSVIVSQVQM